LRLLEIINMLVTTLKQAFTPRQLSIRKILLVDVRQPTLDKKHGVCSSKAYLMFYFMMLDTLS